MSLLDKIVKSLIILVGVGCILGGGFCVVFPALQRDFGGFDAIAMFSGIGALFLVAGVVIIRATRNWGERRPGRVMDFEKPHMREPGERQ